MGAAVPSKGNRTQVASSELRSSRWPSWAPRPNMPHGFCGRKATLNRASALVDMVLNDHRNRDFCIKMGSDESHFNVSVGSGGQSHKTVHKPQPFRRERRSKAVSNRGPSAYQPNALPLGQTGVGHSLSLICQPTSEDMKLYFTNTSGKLA